MPTGRSSPFLPTTSAATCPRASRCTYARGRARASPSCRQAYASAGYGLGPSRGDAAGEPPRARPAQAGAERHRRLLRAHQSGLSGGRDGLSPRAQQARSGARARPAREAQVREALAQSAPQAAGGAVGARAGRVCRRRRGAAAGTAPTPETPASILYTSGTTGRPKGCILSHGYEVAVGRLVCRARRAGDAAPGPGAHLQSAAALSRQRRRRVADGRHRHRQLPDPARPLPSAQRGGARSPQTRATIVHYLGIIAPLLLGQPASAEDAPAWRALRPRRRHRAAAACALRGALRLPADRAVGHDRDGARAVRQPSRRARSARAPSAAPCRASRCASSTTHERDVPDGAARRDAGAPLGGNAAAGLLLGLSRRRGGDGGGLAGRLVPHRRRGLARARRHAAFRRPQEEHHPPLRREHRRRRGGGGAAHPPRRGPGGGDGGQGRAARGGGAGLRGAEAADADRRGGRGAVPRTATSASPTTRRRAGCTSSKACRPPARRRSRSTPSMRPAPTRAASPASSTCARARSAHERASRTRSMSATAA